MTKTRSFLFAYLMKKGSEERFWLGEKWDQSLPCPADDSRATVEQGFAWAVAVGEHTRYGTECPRLQNPRPQEQSHKHHTERAPLRDAAASDIRLS